MTKSEADPRDNSDMDAEMHELTTAVRDVAFSLTHDLSDTPEDIRDALAFAPIGLVKSVNRFVAYVANRPRKAAAMLAGLLLTAAILATLRRRR